MKELQQRRFKEQVEEILGPEFITVTSFNEKINMIDHAQVNTPQKVKSMHLNALMAMANSWYFQDIEIDRSGAGIRIKFIDFKKQI